MLAITQMASYQLAWAEFSDRQWFGLTQTNFNHNQDVPIHFGKNKTLKHVTEESNTLGISVTSEFS